MARESLDNTNDENIKPREAFGEAIESLAPRTWFDAGGSCSSLQDGVQVLSEVREQHSSRYAPQHLGENSQGISGEGIRVDRLSE